jgi:hypothetical protein
MGRIAGHRQYLCPHIAQLAQPRFQNRRRTFAFAEDRCAAVRYLTIPDHIYHRVLLICCRRTLCRQLPQELCRRRRPHSSQHTQFFTIFLILGHLDPSTSKNCFYSFILPQPAATVQHAIFYMYTYFMCFTL